MEALGFQVTKELVDLVLKQPNLRARRVLYEALDKIQSNQAQFFAGIVRFQNDLGLTSEQWLDLVSKLPNEVLWSDLSLKTKLSEEQFKRLPPIGG